MRILLTALALVLLVACSKVNQENFAKIEEGMSEAQVRAILGSPTESNSVTLLGISGTSSRWEGGGAEIVIRFVNGQVALKRFDKPGKAPQ